MQSFQEIHFLAKAVFLDKLRFFYGDAAYDKKTHEKYMNFSESSGESEVKVEKASWQPVKSLILDKEKAFRQTM